MTEFRIPTHNKRYPKKSVNRFVFMVLLVVGVVLWLMFTLRDFAGLGDAGKVNVVPAYSPEAVKGNIYRKPGYSLSYVETYELPEWVSYELTVDMMNAPKHERSQDFLPDPDIQTGSAHWEDYRRSGYRRGHLVPAADMAWDKASMDATFYFSNVAPMRQEFNDGIWLELEHNVRDWSRKHKRVQVVAGPVFDEPVTTIGNNEVLVPRYFYKAVFTLINGKPQAIGFLFDQTDQAFTRLEDYVVTLDSIEQRTGVDLFSNLYGNWDTEIDLESKSDFAPGTWTFHDRWYQQRLETAGSEGR